MAEGELPRAWTVGGLFGYFERVITEMDRRIEIQFSERDKAAVAARESINTALIAARESVAAALTASKEANDKTATNIERRFESVNSFREQLSEQARSMITRAEYDAKHDALISRLNNLEAASNQNTGKSAGITTLWGYIAGAIGMIIGIGSLLVLHK